MSKGKKECVLSRSNTIRFAALHVGILFILGWFILKIKIFLGVNILFLFCIILLFMYHGRIKNLKLGVKCETETDSESSTLTNVCDLDIFAEQETLSGSLKSEEVKEEYTGGWKTEDIRKVFLKLPWVFILLYGFLANMFYIFTLGCLPEDCLLVNIFKIMMLFEFIISLYVLIYPRLLDTINDKNNNFK